MNIKTGIWLAAIPICALAMLAFLEYSLGMNYLMFFLILVLALCFYSIFVISDIFYIRSIRRNMEVEELLIVLDGICRGMRAGERFDRAAARSINGLDRSNGCFTVLSRVSEMMYKGYSFNEAMNSIYECDDRSLRDSETYGFLDRIRVSGYMPPHLSNIYSEYMRFLRESEMNMDRDAGAVQRYITVSMVGGTIMPSLALFGFVGYSILNVSVVWIGMVIMAFVALLPASYGIVRARLGSSYAC